MLHSFSPRSRYNGSRQADRRKLNVRSPFETNEQFAKIGNPAVRVRDDPAMASDSLSCVSADNGAIVGQFSSRSLYIDLNLWLQSRFGAREPCRQQSGMRPAM